MAEIKDGGENSYPKEVAQNYAKLLKEDYDEYLANVPAERLHFGPTFLAKTNKDIDLQIVSLWIDPEEGQKEDDGSLLHKVFFFFAFDGDGENVGCRNIRLSGDDEWLEARGGVVTAVRGRGISTQLELPTILALRIEATKNKTLVYWTAENGNAERLKQAEEKYKKVGDAESAAVLEGIRNEQKGWQALYGSRGKMGFEAKGYKGVRTIQPDRDYQNVDWELKDTAVMHEWGYDDGGRKVMVPWEMKAVYGDKKELRAKKLENWEKVIKPKIEEIVARAA
ncbi:MAG: hypothetical protein Q7S79_04175 [bacterium]|nr:hypothetical protein [bacterium]